MPPRSTILVGAASLLVSFAVSVILTPIIRRWALQREFVDRPLGSGSHKQHKQAIAFGGGIAITVAVLLPIALALILAIAVQRAPAHHLTALSRLLPAWPYWLGGIVAKAPPALAVIAGALVMHLMGIIDDHRPLSPALK